MRKDIFVWSHLETLLLCIYFIFTSELSVSLQGIIQSMHRTILEVIPSLCPTEHLSSLWPQFLEELLSFLPGSSPPFNKKDETQWAGDSKSLKYGSEGLSSSSCDIQTNALPDISADAELISQKQVQGDFVISNGNVACTSSYVFGEKLIPVIVELFLKAPATERGIVSPEIVHHLGRSDIGTASSLLRY